MHWVSTIVQLPGNRGQTAAVFNNSSERGHGRRKCVPDYAGLSISGPQIFFVGFGRCSQSRLLLKGIVYQKKLICWKITHPQAIQNITCSPMGRLQWMGAVRMRVQTADKTSQSNRARWKCSRNVSLPRLAILSTRLLVPSKRHYDIHITWIDCFSRRRGDSATLQ